MAIDLPERTYELLLKTAAAAGISPAEWIERNLAAAPAVFTDPRDEDVAEADARLESTIHDYGRPLGTNNDDIDADLAREYARTNSE